MKHSIYILLVIGCAFISLAQAQERGGKATGAPAIPTDPDSFSKMVWRLVEDANGANPGRAREQLREIDAKLTASDQGQLRRVFIQRLNFLNYAFLGQFEEGLVARYDQLMGDPEKISKEDQAEVEKIAVLGRRMMSKKLATRFLRDVTKVPPYHFRGELVEEGWVPLSIDDWKGFQGRLASGSLACNDLDILNKWIGLADQSKGDFRSVILWAMGYSPREEAAAYLSKQYPRKNDAQNDLESRIAGLALDHVTSLMEDGISRLKEYEDKGFGTLPAQEVKQLRVVWEKAAPVYRQKLKEIGIAAQSSVGAYRD